MELGLTNEVTLTATRGSTEAVARDIRSEFGVEAAWRTGDLLQRADADRVMNAAAAHFGRREILGNNAGALRPNRFGYPNSPRDTDTQAQKEIVNTPSVQRDL